MAITLPRHKHKSIKPKKRIDFLRSNLQAGRYLGPWDTRLRREIFSLYSKKHLPQADSLACYACTKGAAHWHHIVQLSMGGDDHPANLVPLCLSCHKKVHRYSKVRGNRVDRPYKHVPVLVTPKVLVVYVPPVKKVLPPN